MVMLKSKGGLEVENLIEEFLKSLGLFLFLVNGHTLWFIFKCSLFQRLSRHCTLTRIWSMFTLS